MDRDTELALLIKEQERDIKMGDYQPRERFVVLSLDAFDTLEPFDADGHFTAPIDGPGDYGKFHLFVDSCPLHGNQDSFISAWGDFRCRVCRRADEARLRQRDPEKRRAYQREWAARTRAQDPEKRQKRRAIERESRRKRAARKAEEQAS